MRCAFGSCFRRRSTADESPLLYQFRFAEAGQTEITTAAVYGGTGFSGPGLCYSLSRLRRGEREGLADQELLGRRRGRRHLECPAASLWRKKRYRQRRGYLVPCPLASPSFC